MFSRAINNNPRNPSPSSVTPLASLPMRTSASPSATLRSSLTLALLTTSLQKHGHATPPKPCEGLLLPPSFLLPTAVPPKGRELWEKKADSTQPSINLRISPNPLPWPMNTYETSPRSKTETEEGVYSQLAACPTSHAIVDDSIYEPILGLGDDENDV